MSVVLAADERMWLEVPQSFPTAQDVNEHAWEERVLSGMRDAWRGKLTHAVEPVVREALRNALRRRLPEDAVTLQFWPGASLANAIVHVVVGPHPEDGPRLTVPLDDGPYVVPPVSELFEADFLGTGIESRALHSFEAEPPAALGTVGYLFTNERGYVFVGTDPTIPGMVGLLIEPLREVVRSIEIVDDEGFGPWPRSDARQEDIPSRGEGWDVQGGAVA